MLTDTLKPGPGNLRQSLCHTQTEPVPGYIYKLTVISRHVLVMLSVVSLVDISHNVQCNICRVTHNVQCNMFHVILIQIVRDATHSQ